MPTWLIIILVVAAIEASLFAPLDMDAVRRICALQLESLSRKLAAEGTAVSFDGSLGRDAPIRVSAAEGAFSFTNPGEETVR